MNIRSKEIEEFYTRLLQKVLPEFPQGRLARTESPDFILETDVGRIGIEVTRLFKSADSKGRNLQVQESERDLMVNEAMRLYEVKGHPPVEVLVHIAGETHFNKKNRKHFAQGLANLVALRVPSEHSFAIIENDFDEPDAFPYEIHSISIARYGHRRNYWSVPGGGWVQENFATELQSLIDKKNSILAQFNPNCSGHWLLIAIEGVSGSTLFEPSQDTLTHVYTSKFQKIFLLDRLEEKGYELIIKGAS